MDVLPDDCIAFLRGGRQFEFDPSGTSIGHITLKPLADVLPEQLSVRSGSAEEVDDPYGVLDGEYLVDLIDLIAESDDYTPTGLLCWIPAVRRFGCIDIEHGTILTFPSATWTDITSDPVPFLDSQWGLPLVPAEQLLPWLHFPFKVCGIDLTLDPYSDKCPIHGTEVVVENAAKPDLYDVYRHRALESWLTAYKSQFPCAGVPVDERNVKCCAQCHELENAWIAAVENGILPIEARPNSQGWVRCPACGITFPIYAPEFFLGNIHLSCGQKLHIVQ
jgi:hypothetical protein